MRRDRLRHSAAGLWSPRSGDWRADAKPMKVEEYLEDGTCVIRAGLPGIDPETDVDITVADGVLHLTATREERSEEDRP